MVVCLCSYHLKAFFLRLGYQKQDFMDKLGQNAEGLLTAGQWHRSAKFSESGDIQTMLFENTQSYNAKYWQKWNKNAPSLSASASAVGYSLMRAIQEAFRKCNIIDSDPDMLLDGTGAVECPQDTFGSSSDSGYERIRRNLEARHLETILGPVQFDQFHQNTLKTAVTMQVTKGQLQVVLPIGSAAKTMRFPAPNPHKPEKCPKGEYDNGKDYEMCINCPIGTYNNMEGATGCKNCTTGYYQDEVRQRSCKKCPGNAQSAEKATSIDDCSCAFGFYQKGDKYLECEECPVGGVCKGGNHLPYPKPGFWRDVNATDRMLAAEIYECPNPSVCKGDEESECEAGYGGR